MSGSKHILDGIRVVESATMVFVPSVGTIMADFGAEVIKVEGPNAVDPHRWGHSNPGMPISHIPYVFEVDNRSKKSLALNIKEADGYAVFEKLIKSADVFLTNFRPMAVEKLRIAYEDLKALNPRLIYAHGLGYGEKGPEANDPSYDAVTYWARSGIESHAFPADGFLKGFPYGSGDHPAGQALLNGVLLALLDRAKTGQGARVTSSLIHCGAWASSNMLMAELCGAQWQQGVPRERANYAFRYQVTEDKRIIKLNMHNFEKQWPAYCRAMGRPDLIEDPRYDTLEKRTKNMAELNQIFDAFYPQHDLDDCLKTLKAHDIPCSLVSNYQDVANDPQMLANETYLEVDDPRLGKFRTVDSPIRIDGQEKVTPSAAPELGEHSVQVLEDLGFNEPDIQNYIERGVISQK